MLDLSCRRRPGGEERGDFLVVTGKWQKFTSFAVTRENLERLGDCCDEFLVHGVDAEVKIIVIIHVDFLNAACIVVFFRSVGIKKYTHTHRVFCKAREH